MAVERSVVEIGLLLYPGVQTAALHGLTDLFAVAERIAGEEAAQQLPALRVSHWSGEDGGEPRRVFDTHPGAASRLVAVIVPPSLFGLPDAAPLRNLTDWLAARHGEGAIVGSVCIGGLLVAEAGLLDGRSATAHWSGADSFAKRFPRVRLEPHKPMVDDGDLITSAGLMAWSDLGLRIVDRLLGPSIANRTARFLVVEHSDSAQQCGSNFAPLLGHGDAAILKVQHWLQGNGAVDVSLAAMAAACGVIGAGLGVCFFSCSYYCLADPALKHRRSAINECMVGTGALMGNLAFGQAAAAFGAPAPFLFAPLGIAGLAATEFVVLRWSRRSNP